MKKIWKKVKGFETFLEVSNFGDVRTLERTVKINGRSLVRPKRICKQVLKRNGYFQVAVRMANLGRKWFLVHRLVANTFLKNRKQLTQVNHKDGNKKNNFVNNLEWSNSSHNQIHAIKLGLCKNEEQHYKAKLTKYQVKQIRKSTLSHRRLAKKYKMNKSTITAIKNYKIWKYV